MRVRGRGSLYSIFALSLALAFSTNVHAQERIAEVVVENAKIHAQPDADSDVIQDAPVGQVYNILEKVGSWYKIQFKTERLGIQMEGYIHERYVKVLGEEPMVEAVREPEKKKEMKVLMEVVGSYFQPSDQAFKDIYGEGTNFGGEITFTVMRGISLWAGVYMYSNTGLTTFTQEETEISIIPIYGGLKFRASGAKVSPYVGIGVGYFKYKETSAIGSISQGKIGYIGQLGILANVLGSFYLDLKGCYCYCKVQAQEIEVNLGGFQIVGGFGIGF